MDSTAISDIPQETFLYKLLMNPGTGYRLGRHFLLILALLAISFNHVYMGFMEYSSLLGNNLYFFTILILVLYLFEGYFNIYVLVPQFLAKGKYTLYFTFFSLIILLFVIIHYGLEYFVFKWYNVEPGLYSYFKKQGSYFLLEFVAAFFVDFIAVLGAGITVVLKYWMENNRRMHTLEQIHFKTELEKLKEQVTPGFLLKILHNIGCITPHNQSTASDMLIKLSGILRYQLYDCNRSRVLLNAEIHFIENYLKLEKLYYKRMDFEIDIREEVNRILVPPLLFINVVQYTVENFQKTGEYFQIQIYFQSNKNSVSFYCNNLDTMISSSSVLMKIKRRLETIYQGNYLFDILSKAENNYPFIYLQLYS